MSRQPFEKNQSPEELILKLIEKIMNKEGPTPENQQNIIKFLTENPTLINYKTPRGESLLIVSIKYDAHDVFYALLKSHANVDIQDSYGLTALMYAASNGYINRADALLKSGANVNIKDSNELTALMHAVYKINGQNVDMVNLLLNYNINHEDVTSTLKFVESMIIHETADKTEIYNKIIASLQNKQQEKQEKQKAGKSRKRQTSKTSKTRKSNSKASRKRRVLSTGNPRKL